MRLSKVHYHLLRVESESVAVTPLCLSLDLIFVGCVVIFCGEPYQIGVVGEFCDGVAEVCCSVVILYVYMVYRIRVSTEPEPVL